MAKMRLMTDRILFAVASLLFIGLLVLGYLCFYRPMTTVILVRHAEKNIEPGNNNPSLSPAGQQRAQELVRVLGNAGITAIYGSQYSRTQQTAQPLANHLSLPVNQAEANNTAELVRRIKSEHQGGVVFVAGHNNTVPAIIGGLGGGNFPIIPESEYDNLFVVTLYPLEKAKVVKLKYGSPLPASGQGMNP
ncbi:MAG: phosphoglycerate mutase family protein [Pyrinomonadaceae bacterium]